jgi:hypothetical protein
MNYYRYAGEPARYDFEWDGQALAAVKPAPGSLGAVPASIPWSKLLLWGALGYVAYRAMSGTRSNPDDGSILAPEPVESDLTEQISDDVDRIMNEAATTDAPAELPADTLKGRLTINQIVNQPDHNNRFGQAATRARRGASAAAAPAAPARSRRRGRAAARQGSRLRPFQGRP